MKNKKKLCAESKEYYDSAYSQSKEYTKEPEDILHYYDLWKIGLEHVKFINPKTIIELGRGPGHFAKMLTKENSLDLERYLGIDFSEVALEYAKDRCEDGRFFFKKLDLCKCSPSEFLVESTGMEMQELKDVDVLHVSYECLEHINCDIKVITALEKDAWISFSLPSFHYRGHVRFFEEYEDLERRYSKHLEIVKKDIYVKDEKNNKKWYICLGRRI